MDINLTPYLKKYVVADKWQQGELKNAGIGKVLQVSI